jgi:hypothetical protein
VLISILVLITKAVLYRAGTLIYIVVVGPTVYRIYIVVLRAYRPIYWAYIGQYPYI